MGDYVTYSTNLRNTTHQAIGEGRTILVYTPTKYKDDTLSFLTLSAPIPPNVLLVPTVGTTVEIDYFLVGLDTIQFYQLLSLLVRQAEICGEYRKGCVDFIMEDAKNINITPLNECIFPPPDAVY
ncbi:hypothetical protein HYW87_04565 [Candidatus Roizmanbacteria bacterium]|nr:hypothetical protein [Candidatus Roizmanbacteria bacterium]